MGQTRRGFLQVAGLAGIGALGLTVAGATPAHAAVQWYWPLRQPGSQTGWYTTTNTAYTANPPWHHALDIVNGGADQTVCAVAAGIVEVADAVPNSNWYGNHVRIRHADGYWSSYSHMESTPLVSVGQSVAASTPLGKIGNTGNPSYGRHLHLEILHGGTNRNGAGDKRIDPLSVLSGAPLAGGVPVVTSDRSFVINTGGDLQGKAGIYDPVVMVRTGVKFAAADGDTLAVVTNDGTVWVKQGAFGAGWTAMIGNAKAVAVDGERFVVLSNDGTVIAKDGLYSTNWTTQLGGASQVEASNGRIGVLSGGDLYVKQGGLWGDWSLQTGGVADFALDGNRIGIVGTNGVASVKEGTLSDPWVGQLGSCTRIELAGTRVGVLAVSGELLVKEDNLWSSWTHVGNGTDFALSGDRVALVTGSSGMIKAGALNAGWIGAFSGAQKIFLS